jgi:hypothetical protein
MKTAWNHPSGSMSIKQLFFRWYFVVDSDLREGDINAMTVAEYFEFCDEIFGDFIFKDS